MFILQAGNAPQPNHDLFIEMLNEMRNASDGVSQQVNVPSSQISQHSADDVIATPEDRSGSSVTASLDSTSESDSPALAAASDITASADTAPVSEASAPSSQANTDATMNDVRYFDLTEDTQGTQTSVQNQYIIFQSGHQNAYTPGQYQTRSPVPGHFVLRPSGRQKRKAPADFTSQSQLKQQRRSIPATQTGFPLQMQMMYYNADLRGYWEMAYDYTASGHYLQYPVAYPYYQHHCYQNPVTFYPREADWRHMDAARKAQGIEATHTAAKPHG